MLRVTISYPKSETLIADELCDSPWMQRIVGGPSKAMDIYLSRLSYYANLAVTIPYAPSQCRYPSVMSSALDAIP